MACRRTPPVARLRKSKRAAIERRAPTSPRTHTEFDAASSVPLNARLLKRLSLTTVSAGAGSMSDASAPLSHAACTQAQRRGSLPTRAHARSCTWRQWCWAEPSGRDGVGQGLVGSRGAYRPWLAPLPRWVGAALHGRGQYLLHGEWEPELLLACRR